MRLTPQSSGESGAGDSISVPQQHQQQQQQVMVSQTVQQQQQQQGFQQQTTPVAAQTQVNNIHVVIMYIDEMFNSKK